MAYVKWIVRQMPVCDMSDGTQVTPLKVRARPGAIGGGERFTLYFTPVIGEQASCRWSRGLW